MPKVIEDEIIYRAVMQAVLERGYAGATTKQMAETAGVSEVTLFRKYESKPQLVKQAITWLADCMDLAAEADYSGDLSADLLRIVRAYQDVAVQYGPFFVVILSEMSRNPQLADLIEAPMQIFSEMGEMLARYQAEGALWAEHPIHALAALLGPLMYSSMMRVTISDPLMPPLDLARHVESFLDGRRIVR